MLTMRPACNGDMPANGTLFVPISHTIMAKLYISAALLSTSSGRLCRATANINMEFSLSTCQQYMYIHTFRGYMYMHTNSNYIYAYIIIYIYILVLF